MSLSQEQITQLLSPTKRTTTPTRSSTPLTDALKKLYPTRPQIGPLRYHDDEDRCTSRGCGSPTHYTLMGARKCESHCLKEMNLLLVDTSQLAQEEEIIGEL
jgi:hypothetical protein